MHPIRPYRPLKTDALKRSFRHDKPRAQGEGQVHLLKLLGPVGPRGNYKWMA